MLHFIREKTLIFQNNPNFLDKTIKIVQSFEQDLTGFIYS